MEDNLARLTSKGQITIPKRIRDKINAKRGDYLLFQIKGNKIEMKKAFVSSFEKLSQKTQKRFEQLGVTEKDVEKAIKWARSRKR